MPDDDGGFSGFDGFLFLAQIIALPLITWLLGLAVVEGFDAAIGTRGGILIASVRYAAVGLAEGYFIQKASQCADQSGGYFAWLPIICVIVISTLRDGRGTGPALRELLTWSPYSIGGAASELLTMPAWASCWYSVGIALANRRRDSPRMTEPV